jgi:1-acyl-sn-glycerol-3-phosphate acyltransferase
MRLVWKKIRQGFHIAAKAFAFFCFGLGSLFLALLIFPLFRLFTRHTDRQRKILRKIISLAFAFFVNLMRFLRLISLKIINLPLLKSTRQMLICANHPSLIDVVILISLVPQADCIVKAKLWKNILMRNVIRSVYIPNSLSFEEMIRECDWSLRAGNNLVIFPEGTRTEENQEVKLQRCAAQIALRTGFSILPVCITADSPVGLRKGDSLFTAPETGIVRYQLEIKPPLLPDAYAHLSVQKAARILTHDLNDAIIPGNKKVYL